MGEGNAGDQHGSGLASGAIRSDVCGRIDLYTLQAIARGERRAADFTSTGLTERGISVVAAAVRMCERRFLAVNLADNPGIASDRGASQIASMIDVCRGIGSLDLTGCQLGDDHINRLAKHIAYAPNLRSIFLSMNRFTSVAADNLVHLLASQGSPVKHIDLSYNDLGDGIAESFHQAMTRFGEGGLQLRSIALNSCGMTDTGGEWMAKAIRLMPSLRRLWMYENHIGFQGATQVIRSIDHSGIHVSILSR